MPLKGLLAAVARKPELSGDALRVLCALLEEPFLRQDTATRWQGPVRYGYLGGVVGLDADRIKGALLALQAGELILFDPVGETFALTNLRDYAAWPTVEFCAGLAPRLRGAAELTQSEAKLSPKSPQSPENQQTIPKVAAKSPQSSAKVEPSGFRSPTEGDLSDLDQIQDQDLKEGRESQGGEYEGGENIGGTLMSLCETDAKVTANMLESRPKVCEIAEKLFESPEIANLLADDRLQRGPPRQQAHDSAARAATLRLVATWSTELQSAYQLWVTAVHARRIHGGARDSFIYRLAQELEQVRLDLGDAYTAFGLHAARSAKSGAVDNANYVRRAAATQARRAEQQEFGLKPKEITKYEGRL